MVLKCQVFWYSQVSRTNCTSYYFVAVFSSLFCAEAVIVLLHRRNVPPGNTNPASQPALLRILPLLIVPIVPSELAGTGVGRESRPS